MSNRYLFLLPLFGALLFGYCDLFEIWILGLGILHNKMVRASMREFTYDR